MLYQTVVQQKLREDYNTNIQNYKNKKISTDQSKAISSEDDNDKFSSPEIKRIDAKIMKLTGIS